MQILLTTAYSALFLFLIGKLNFFKIPGISGLFLKCGFLIKLFAGIAVGLIYTYYYTDRLTADTFKFFDDSKVLFDALKSNPVDYLKMLTGIGAGSPALQHYYDTMNNWYDTFSPFNDNRTMIRLNAFIRLFSMGYYYVHVVVVSFLSYVGIIAIVRVFAREYPELIRSVFLIFLLLPSVLFWGSGLLKDALVFFTMGLSLFYFDRMLHDSHKKSISMLMLLISLFLLMMTKFQVFLLTVPLLVAWYIAYRYKVSAFISFLSVSICFFIIVYLFQFLVPQTDIIHLLANKQQAFIALAKEAGAGSIISIPVLEPTLSSVLINAPVGFFICLVRPFITDTGAVLNTISAIENTIILLIAIYCIVKFDKRNIKGKIIPFFCLFYTVFSFGLIGMITPVLGAIVRYKAQALPYMVVLLVIISHPVVTRFIEKVIPSTQR